LPPDVDALPGRIALRGPADEPDAGGESVLGRTSSVLRFQSPSIGWAGPAIARRPFEYPSSGVCGAYRTGPNHGETVTNGRWFLPNAFHGTYGVAAINVRLFGSEGKA
jgi:hypothetical protein